jgi:hypothetical protein
MLYDQNVFFYHSTVGDYIFFVLKMEKESYKEKVYGGKKCTRIHIETKQRFEEKCSKY